MIKDDYKGKENIIVKLMITAILGRDENGCTMEGKCIRLEKKQWGDDKGSNCPGYCPPGDCKETEYLCPDDFPGRDRFDICDGCPLEKICVEPAKDKNGKFQIKH